MTPAVAEQRDAVVAEARSWLGTPYHHHGRIKGPQGGVDCAQLLYLVYHACGLTPEMPPMNYSVQWHLHQSGERFLGILRERCRPVAAPLPGDLVMFRYGRAYSHGAIVEAWPLIIHADISPGIRRVAQARGDQGTRAQCAKLFFSAWPAESCHPSAISPQL